MADWRPRRLPWATVPLRPRAGQSTTTPASAPGCSVQLWGSSTAQGQQALGTRAALEGTGERDPVKATAGSAEGNILFCRQALEAISLKLPGATKGAPTLRHVRKASKIKTSGSGCHQMDPKANRPGRPDCMECLLLLKQLGTGSERDGLLGDLAHWGCRLPPSQAGIQTSLRLPSANAEA